MDRKNKRKLQRMEKKRRKNFHYKRLKFNINDDVNDVNNDKQNDDGNDDEDIEEEIRKNKFLTKDYYRKHQKRLIRDEEKEIKKYEKLLKLRNYRKRNKLPKSFHLDGLAELIEFCNQRENNNTINCSDSIDNDENDSMDEENDDGIDNDIDGNIDDDEQEQQVEDEESIIEDKNDDDDDELHEDIYGFIRDKRGNIIKNENNLSDKKRESLINNIKIDENLQRKIRGLLNRLTISNIHIICNEFINLYQLNNVNRSQYNFVDNKYL